MNEHIFLMGQRMATPEGGEVVDTIGDKIIVKLDYGHTQAFPSDDVHDDTSAS